jgi:hypothetical protein
MHRIRSLLFFASAFGEQARKVETTGGNDPFRVAEKATTISDCNNSMWRRRQRNVRAQLTIRPSAARPGATARGGAAAAER